MGAEGPLGERRLRQLERRLGEPLHTAIAVHWPEVSIITPDDRHFMWDRKTDEIVQDEAPGWHWKTCPTVLTRAALLALRWQ